MDSVVSLDQAVTLLGAFPALAGLDLEVSRGEVVLLQGPNGAGKTTLLRLCAGLLRLESGSGTVLGADLDTARQTLRRRVGLVGHATMLYDDLSVEENVRFWSRAAGVGDSAVDAALRRLELETRLRAMPVRRLSAGQRRRTAIAAMVVRRPELWLLDEPHAGLDQAARDVVDELILEAVDSGATVVVASHELDRVRAVTSRVVTIAGGTVYSDHLIEAGRSTSDG
jgi:heme ABC exporter ATP-binding subunit CcmA